MTTRRIFVAGPLAASRRTSFAGLALAPKAQIAPKIKTKDGTELFVKDTGGTAAAPWS